ncbi:prepilin-type N-terminal cleavage/methylation domain-containing protein [Candidatus Kaiserbacteria bacterium]|nr:prepilin-type N-terminal cleavage/methylation domain-containing protein [Candidatus Kaiserbacteria bacterium]
MFFKITYNDKKSPATAGFSLVELLVTISIVTLITAIVMIRYSSFDSSVLLNNQAYEIALDIRETQVRAISIQARDPGTGDAFTSNYGLFYDIDEPTEYIFFQDTGSNNGKYDLGEEIETLHLDGRFIISSITSNGSVTENEASIIFKRPNFDAIMEDDSNNSLNSVEITVQAKRNSSSNRKVIIYSSGQVTVE